MSLSKANETLIEAYNRGYRIINGICYGYKGKPIKGCLLKRRNSPSYVRFSIKIERQIRSFKAHRLVAYQKYGDEIFKDEICVRHLDGNPLNNREDNIAIGTQSDNMMDRKPLARHLHAKVASSHIRRFSNEEVAQIKLDHKNGMSYKKLCIKYNTSKSTLSYLFNEAQYAQ